MVVSISVATKVAHGSMPIDVTSIVVPRARKARAVPTSEMISARPIL